MFNFVKTNPVLNMKVVESLSISERSNLYICDIFG